LQVACTTIGLIAELSTKTYPALMFVPAGEMPVAVILMFAPDSTFRFTSKGSVGLFTVTDPEFPTYVMEETVALPVMETSYCNDPAAEAVMGVGETVHVFGVSFFEQEKEIRMKVKVRKHTPQYRPI
jgi:hypothetical protein